MAQAFVFSEKQIEIIKIANAKEIGQMINKTAHAVHRFASTHKIPLNK